MSKKNLVRKKKFEDECIEAAMEGVILHFIESVRARGGVIACCMNQILENHKIDPMAVRTFAVAHSRFRKGMPYDSILLDYSISQAQN